ncbi:MAG: hypothetical protein ABII74_10800 [Elusimicrobiota bacterium]
MKECPRLEEKKITTVVAAHFLPISLLKNTPKKIELNVVVTDYYAHSLWVGSLRIAQQNSAGRICEAIFPSLTGTVRGVE